MTRITRQKLRTMRHNFAEKHGLKKAKKPQPDHETALAMQIRVMGLPAAEQQYQFAAHHAGGPGKGVRKRLQEVGLKDWRFDFAWPEHRLAVEIEGGAFTGGRHTRGAGFSNDLIKYHNAMKLGWSVYRCDGKMVKNGMAIDLIDQILTKRGKHNGTN